MAPFPSRDGHRAQVSGRKPTEQGGEQAPGCAGAMGGRGAAPRHVGCEQGLAAPGRQQAGLAARILGTCWGTAPVWGWRCNLELSLLITSFSGNVEYVLINHQCQGPPVPPSPHSSLAAFFASLKYILALYKLKHIKYLITESLYRVFYFMLC